MVRPLSRHATHTASLEPDLGDLITRRRQDERPRAVGAFRLTGLEAGLREQRSLLVDHEPGHRERPAERIRLADRRGAVDHLRLCVRIETEERTRFLGPSRRLEVQQHGPRRRGRVGHERPGELVIQPGVHRGDHITVAEVPAGPAPQPRHLRRREVRIEGQARQLHQPVRVPFELPGHLHRAPILPAECRPGGAPCCAVPDQDGLALVRDPDRLHRSSCGSQGLSAGREDRVQEFLRVLFDRVIADGDGVDRRVALAENLSVRPRDERLGGRGPLVDRENVDAPLPFAGRCPASLVRASCVVRGIAAPHGFAAGSPA